MAHLYFACKYRNWYWRYFEPKDNRGLICDKKSQSDLYSLGIRQWVASFSVSTSRGTVRAYRIYHFFVEGTVMDGVVLCKYFAGKCRGVSHTPWCGRTGNDCGEHTIVESLPTERGKVFPSIPFWTVPLLAIFAVVEGVCPCAPTVSLMVKQWLNDNNLPLKLFSGFLHRVQSAFERLYDGFASWTKGPWTFAWRFCTCAKRPWS